MINHKKLILLLLKQVLWGVRRGNTHGSICDLFDMRLSRIGNHTMRRNIQLDSCPIRRERRRIMKQAVEELGWTFVPFYPVPHPTIPNNQYALITCYEEGTLWDGEYGKNRMALLCRMIWVLKNEIHMEQLVCKSTSKD